MKRRIVITALAILFALVGVPLIINLIMRTPNANLTILSSETQQTWLNFYGSYLGGITGAALTVFVSYLISKHLDSVREKQDIKSKYTIKMFDDLSIIRSEEYSFTTETYSFLIDIFNSKIVDKKLSDNLQDKLKGYYDKFQNFINTHTVLLIDECLMLDDLNSKYCSCLVKVSESFKKSDADKIIEYFNESAVKELNDLRVKVDLFFFHIINKYLKGIMPNVPPQSTAKFEKINEESVKKFRA